MAIKTINNTEDVDHRGYVISKASRALKNEIQSFQTGSAEALLRYNVTPMIDILSGVVDRLYGHHAGYASRLEPLVPQTSEKNNQPQKENDTAIVVSIMHGGAVNPPTGSTRRRAEVRSGGKAANNLLHTRDEVMFIKGDKDLDLPLSPTL